jgi:hypothetical protein
MLTDRQRARCREIAEALDAGDGKAIAKAEAIAPLSRDERSLIWDLRGEVAAGVAHHPPPNSAGGDNPLKIRGAQNFAVTVGAVDDLDYWPEVEGKPETVPRKRTPMPMPRTDDDEPVMPDHDDEDDTEQTTKTCPTCMGKGRDHSGRSCPTCGGTGRIPMNDVGDDGDDGEEEARSFYGFIEDED